MISYFLNSSDEAIDFCFKFNLKYPSSRRGFFKTLNINNNLSVSDLTKILKASSTQMTFVNFEQSTQEELIDLCLKLNVATGETIIPILNDKISGDLYRSSSDQLLIKNYDELARLRKHQFITIELNKNNIKILNRILSQLTQDNISHFILRTNSLDISNDAEELKNQLLLYKIKSTSLKNIFFCPSDKRHLRWSYKTVPSLSGPRYIDIDISNKCTHSCLFCGLYSPEVIKSIKDNNDGKLPKDVSSIMTHEIDFNNFTKILEKSYNAKNICLGGMGDPLLHRDFFKMAKEISNLNINFQVFTNFSYLSNEEIEAISSLASYDEQSINFLVNLSAATPYTYSKVRPKQTTDEFTNIVEKIKFASSIKKKSKRGIKFSLLSVINTLNYHELLLYPILAQEIGAQEFWPKPIEIHNETMLKYSLNEEQESNLAYLSVLCIYLAKKIGVNLEYKDYLLGLIEKHNIVIHPNEVEAKLSEELQKFNIDLNSILSKTSKLEERAKIHIQNEYFSIDEEYSDEEIDLYYSNKPNESFYQDFPCYIAHDYIRFLVDGSVHSCCVSNIETGNLNQSTFEAIWNSSRIENFRKFTEEFPSNNAISNTQEWNFCKSCSHLGFNKKFNFNIKN